MDQRPRFSSDPWHHSEAEDYAKARSDDERRRMLFLFGVDKAHLSELERLFPPPDVAASGEEHHAGHEPHEAERHDEEGDSGMKPHKLLSPEFLIPVIIALAGVVIGFLAWRFPA